MLSPSFLQVMKTCMCLCVKVWNTSLTFVPYTDSLGNSISIGFSTSILLNIWLFQLSYHSSICYRSHKISSCPVVACTKLPCCSASVPSIIACVVVCSVPESVPCNAVVGLPRRELKLIPAGKQEIPKPQVWTVNPSPLCLFHYQINCCDYITVVVTKCYITFYILDWIADIYVSISKWY